MYQKVMAIGYLGRDPELKYLPDGRGISNFSVATTRVRVSAEGDKMTETTWFRVTAWGKLAEAVVQSLHKGSRVYVEGALMPDIGGNPRVYQKQDGTPAASYEMTARVVMFLDDRAVDDDSQGDAEYF